MTVFRDVSLHLGNIRAIADVVLIADSELDAGHGGGLMKGTISSLMYVLNRELEAAESILKNGKTD